MVLLAIWLAFVTLTPSPSSSEFVTRLMGAKAVDVVSPARVRSAFTPASISMFWFAVATPSAFFTVSGVEVRMCSVGLVKR